MQTTQDNAMADRADFGQGKAHHAAFLRHLPYMEGRARKFFGRIRCPGKRDDAVQEAIAHAWQDFIRTVEAGKETEGLIGQIIYYSCAKSLRGQRFTGGRTAECPYSAARRREGSFAIVSLNADGYMDNCVLQGAPEYTVRAAIPDQVAFRVDWTAWTNTLPHLQRDILADVSAGDTLTLACRKRGLCQMYAVRLRQELVASWQNFCRQELEN